MLSGALRSSVGEFLVMIVHGGFGRLIFISRRRERRLDILFANAGVMASSVLPHKLIYHGFVHSSGS